MDGIAFYAPMKSPNDPVPSGDRTMARNLVTALSGIGLGPVWLASEMRSRDSKGDSQTQDELFREAEAEKERIARQDAPSLWVTYHSYYKAPDLIGPALARHWGIPYVLVEATRAFALHEIPRSRRMSSFQQSSTTVWASVGTR